MSAFFQNLLLALVWTLLTGDMSFGNLVIGFALGYVILLFQQALARESRYFRKANSLVSFILYFLWEFVVSSMRVAYDVLTPTLYAKPGIVAVPLDAETDLEITSLASAITLTPGTLSLDVSEDRSTIYIHAMYAEDPEALRREIKEGMEKRLLELMR
jgi:multicomponent Na+:H+ antiporter subunit E